MCQAAPSYAIAATTAAMLGAGDGSTKCRATGASGGGVSPQGAKYVGNPWKMAVDLVHTAW